MLNTQGMTSAGIERKATARALFSKLLYLSGKPKIPHSQDEILVSLSFTILEKTTRYVFRAAMHLNGLQNRSFLH